MDINYKKQIAYTMDKVYHNGLTTLSGGNISVKIDSTIYITPGGKDKGNLTENDIILVNDNKTIGPHKPSSEFPFHKKIYEVRPDIKAIIHAHPKGLVALSAVRKLPLTHLISEVNNLIPKVSLAKYALPGSDKLGENISTEFKKGSDIVILENHGVVIGGKDLKKCYLILETLELFVQIEMNALKLNKPFVNNGNLELIDNFNYGQKFNIIDNIKIREDIIKIIKRAYKQNIFRSFFGIISVRLNENDFIITPNNKECLDITVNDLLLVHNKEVQSDNNFNPYIQLHYDIYQKHPEINSLIQAIPCNLMAYGISEAKFNSHIIPEGYILLKEVKKFKPNEYLKIVETISRENPVIIVENNFAVVAGGNLLQTYDRLEVLEFGASSLINTNVFDKVYSIGDKEIIEINNNFNVW